MLNIINKKKKCFIKIQLNSKIKTKKLYVYNMQFNIEYLFYIFRF